MKRSIVRCSSLIMSGDAMKHKKLVLAVLLVFLLSLGSTFMNTHFNYANVSPFHLTAHAEIDLDTIASNLTLNDVKEYNGHYYGCYYFENENNAQVYDVVKAFCESIGGHLVTISSVEENAVVQSLNVLTGNNLNVTIGLRYSAERNTWVWANEEPNGYRNWQRTVYAYYLRNGDGYSAYVDRTSGISYEAGKWWYHEDANHLVRAFICEWESEEPYLNGTNHKHQLRFDNENTAIVCDICGYHLELSPVVGFKFGRDNFSFSHADLQDGAISKIGYKRMHPELKVDPVAIHYNKEIGVGKEYEVKPSEWGGSCYGLACMNSSFLYNVSVRDFGGNTVYDLRLDNNIKLKDSINIMQYSQLSLGNLPQVFNIGSLYKKAVSEAKKLKKGCYLPVIGFKKYYEDSHDYANHYVNVIGILPDDFDPDYYVLIINDCNESEPKCIAITKDYSAAYYCNINCKQDSNDFIYREDNRQLTILRVLTDPVNNIRAWAPGLITDSEYNALRAPNLENTDIEDTEDQVSLDGYVRFLLASDGEMTVTGNDGTQFTLNNNEITDTNLEEVYAEKIYDFGLTAVFVPPTADLYEISSDQRYYANVTFNGSISAFYCRNGGVSNCDLSGKVEVNTLRTGSYYEMGAYKYDLIKDCDVISVMVSGTNSDTSLDYSMDAPKIESDDMSNIIVSVLRDNDDFTFDEVALQTDACTQIVSLNTTDPETGDINVDYQEAHDYHIINTSSPSCTVSGYTGDEICSICGQTKTKGAEIPALGHAEADASGNCTRCGEHIKDVSVNSNLCKYCGKDHSGSVWQRIIGFFHSIAYFFSHLFGKM